MTSISSKATFSTEALQRDTIEYLTEKKGAFSKSELVDRINRLSTDRLKDFVDGISATLANDEAAPKLLTKFANLMPLDKMEEAEKTNAEELASHLSIGAKQYFDQANQKSSYTKTRILFDEVKGFAIALLEGALDMVGLTTLFDTTDSPTAKAQKIIILTSFVTTLSGVLLFTMGSIHGLFAIAAILVVLIGLSRLYAKIRPMPFFLPEMTNWTHAYRKGTLDAPKHVSEKLLDSMADMLTTGRANPLLLGQIGSGKTELVKALVKAVEEGKYPALKGKTIFYADAGNLNKAALSLIEIYMRRHREDIIVVFDNIHQSFNTLADPKLGQMLENGEYFPSCIGISSEEEFNKHIKDHPAFLKRFRTLRTENLSREDSILIAKREAMKTSALMGPITIERLVEKTEKIFKGKAPMPNAALKVLRNCIHKTSESQKTSLDLKIAKLKNEILIAEDSMGVNALLDLETEQSSIRKLSEKKLELMRLEETRMEKNLQIQQFFKLRNQLKEMRESVLKLSLDVVNHPSESDQTLLLLIRNSFIPAFEANLKGMAKELGIKTEIDEEMIDAAIEEEKQLLS